MNVLSKKEIGLVIKFLNYNYPTRRLKVDGFFKRVILIDTRSFVLNNKNQKESLLNELVSIVRKIFVLNTQESYPLVKLYLNI